MKQGCLIVLVTMAGLLLRWRKLGVPAFLAKFGGDALWAWLVFLVFGFLFLHAPTRKVALWAWTFSWAIEFSQIYHAPWIDALRRTIPGALILGSTFNVPDLFAYVVGIGLGALVERVAGAKVC
jgi:hypothetical protein